MNDSYRKLKVIYYLFENNIEQNRNQQMKETNVRVLHKITGTYSSLYGEISTAVRAMSPITTEKMRASNKSLNPNIHGYIWYENAYGNLEKRYIFPSVHTYKTGKQVIQMIFQDEINTPHVVTPTQQKTHVYYDSE